MKSKRSSSISGLTAETEFITFRPRQSINIYETVNPSQRLTTQRSVSLDDIYDIPLESPGVNFTNILRVAFCTKVFCTVFLLLQFGFEFFWQKNIVAKDACKMLMKLTIGIEGKKAVGLYLKIFIIHQMINSNVIWFTLTYEKTYFCSKFNRYQHLFSSALFKEIWSKNSCNCIFISFSLNL